MRVTANLEPRQKQDLKFQDKSILTLNVLYHWKPLCPIILCHCNRLGLVVLTSRLQTPFFHGCLLNLNSITSYKVPLCDVNNFQHSNRYFSTKISGFPNRQPPGSLRQDLFDLYDTPYFDYDHNQTILRVKMVRKIYTNVADMTGQWRWRLSMLTLAWAYVCSKVHCKQWQVL